MNKLALLLPIAGFACAPVATIDGGEIFGFPFVPGAAIVQPSDDGDRSLAVFIAEDASTCEQLQGGSIGTEAAKILVLQVFDSEEALAPGDYSVDGQNIGGTFLQKDDCEDDGFFAISTSGTITLDSYAVDGDASGSFDLSLAELDLAGGLPNTDSVDGTFNATFCDFDPDELADPCAE